MDFARPDYRRSETTPKSDQRESNVSTCRRAGAVIGVELQRKLRPSAAGSPYRGVRLAALSCFHGCFRLQAKALSRPRPERWAGNFALLQIRSIRYEGGQPA
jgi:hypothetical protein